MQIRNLSAVVLGCAFVLFSTTSSAWQIIEGFDDETNGEFCGTFWGMSWKSTVTTENSAAGGKSCKMAINQGSNGWGGGVSLLANGQKIFKGGEMWVRFRMFMPNDFDYGVYGEGDTLKFLRFEFRGATKSTYDFELMREGNSEPFGVIVSNNPCTSYSDCWDFFGEPDDAPIKGTWDTWEMYIKVDDVPVDDGGQGKMLAWRNGVLVSEQTKNPTILVSDQGVVSMMFFTYWNGGSPKTQHLYFDDLVITNERPAATDSQGNAYIGMGGFVADTPPVTLSPPNPPNILQ